MHGFVCAVATRAVFLAFLYLLSGLPTAGTAGQFEHIYRPDMSQARADHERERYGRRSRDQVRMQGADRPAPHLLQLSSECPGRDVAGRTQLPAGDQGVVNDGTLERKDRCLGMRIRNRRATSRRCKPHRAVPDDKSVLLVADLPPEAAEENAAADEVERELEVCVSPSKREAANEEDPLWAIFYVHKRRAVLGLAVHVARVSPGYFAIHAQLDRYMTSPELERFVTETLGVQQHYLKYRYAVGVIALILAVASFQDDFPSLSVGVLITRSKGECAKRKKENPELRNLLAYRPMMRVMDALEEMGLVRIELGEWRPGKGRRTAMYLTEQGLRWFEEIWETTVIVSLRRTGRVILKDKNKQELAYGETDETREWEAMLELIADVTREHTTIPAGVYPPICTCPSRPVVDIESV